MKVAYVECRKSGISGDMLLASLIHAYGDKSILEKIVSEVENYGTLQASIEEEKFPGYKILIKGERKLEHVDELKKSSSRILENLGVKKWKKNIRRAVDLLEEAESCAHKYEKHHHLHELADLDTLLDLTGVGFLLELLNIEKAYFSPVGIGSGEVSFSHGTFQAPAPAVECLISKYKLPVMINNSDCELSTPTGVALAISLSSDFLENFRMKVEKIGIGYGTRKVKYPFRKVRTYIGEIKDYKEIYLLETHVDDVTPEVIGLFLEEANKVSRDAYAFPVTGKKNRPGFEIRVQANENELDGVLDLFFNILGTGGVRITRANRIEAMRRKTKEGVELIYRGRKIRKKHEFEGAKRKWKKEKRPFHQILEKNTEN